MPQTPRADDSVSGTDDAVSLLRLGKNCCADTTAERLTVLVDGDEYFDGFVRTAERAQRSILILGWDFDSRTPLAFDDQGRPTLLLGEFLNRLARRRRGLQIRILNWDYPMVFGKDRELLPTIGLNWKPHRRVHYRFDNTHPPGGSHHQKIVVIDDKVAFVGGLDLTSKRWDSCEHLPSDPRRVAGGKPYPPFHDMMAMVDGGAARALAAVARNRWLQATGETLSPVQTKADPWPPLFEPMMQRVAVGVACTSAAVDSSGGNRDVEQLYLDMIAAAKRYIYIENQYFTSAKIGDALAARLQEDDPPEIVLVTRLLSHGWLEEMTMHVLRVGLVRRLRQIDRHGRFHAYYPHVEGLEKGTCVDMHSKLMIVDDQWLRIGSSNISNRSMGLDSECDVLIEARGDSAFRQTIRAFRDRLIAEHAGVPASQAAAAIERAGRMSAAIATFDAPGKRLSPLDELPDWSDTLVSTVKLADPEDPVSFDRLVDYFAPAPVRTTPTALWRPLAATAAAVAALAVLWRFTPVAELISADSVIGFAERFSSHAWAPLILMLAYTPACFVMFPRPLITLALAVAFGPWLGFGYAMAGILFAATATYLVGRRMPEYAVRRYAGERFARLDQVLRKHGLLAMTVLRLVPIAPFAVEGVIAGAMRLRLTHLLVGTFVGMLPGVLTATVFGDQLEAGLRDPGAVNFWVIGLVVLLLLVATMTARWWFRRLERSALAELRRQRRAPVIAAAVAH